MKKIKSYKLDDVMVYKKDVIFNKETGFWMYGRRKICGRVLNKGTTEICKKFPMNNGRCYLHGGSRMKGLSKTVKGQIASITPENLKQASLGETFHARLSQYEKNPDIYDMRKEIAKSIVLTDMLLEGLEDDNLAFLSTKIGKLIEITSSVKEKYHKIRQGYLDIYAVKLIITQLQSIVSEFKNQTRVLITEKDNLKKLESLYGRTIDGIANIKLPIVSE